MPSVYIILLSAGVAIGAFGAQKTASFANNKVVKPLYHHVLQPVGHAGKAFARHQVKK